MQPKSQKYRCLASLSRFAIVAIKLCPSFLGFVYCHEYQADVCGVGSHFYKGIHHVIALRLFARDAIFRTGLLIIVLVGNPCMVRSTRADDVGSLKLAVAGRFKIGVGTNRDLVDHPQDRALLLRHFDIVTPENCMKPQVVQPFEGDFRFDLGDAFVKFAEEHGLKVVGHCLVWADSGKTPSWWMTENGQPTSKETLFRRMKTHIQTVAGRYGDRISEWDVVNEALSDGSDGYLRDTLWARVAGEDFIVRAFEYTREVAPNALLVYNDYNVDTDGKRDSLIRLVQSLKQKNTPIDAVGLQGHYELDAIAYEGLGSMLEAMRQLQVKVIISELDIDVIPRSRWWADNNRHRDELKSSNPYKDGCPPEILQRQAEQYAKLFELFCRYDDVVERVSFWNLHDGQSWLNYFPWDRVNHPLLFDRNRMPKPAYHAVIRTVRQSILKASHLEELPSNAN
ncbi:endo-1,4-beta-xylanase [Rhodopirellula rubra]|uniref:Beta-xylanase n=1 Tax=Aporhodopirellula rubra TaxID=980271 RepID=A0A7W5DXU6_9BACT|nr:endo-1,4-beta-xylanase [Aporhodopirellula rubra]MBB3206172.1 endo-1,4-beta-xylanase [Aporhodopirellula rubra]